MSKKNSNVILKNYFENYKELSNIYSVFKKKLASTRKKSFLIAVSGGPDSLALTALGKLYSYETKSKIYYVLINHNIRKNSSKEANAVKSLLKKHKIKLDIIVNKKSIDKNIQGMAREIRYNFLMSYCKKKKIKIILTAHNLEDQVETFFIRLSRGSGLKGLSSMKPVNKVNKDLLLMRPLLDYKKSQLIKISKTIFGKFYKDPSNINTRYLRTRVRNLKNILEKSGIRYDQIIRSIKNLASSRDTLEQYSNKIFKEMVIKKKDKILIKLEDFLNLNDEMKMRLFMQTITDFRNIYYAPRSKKIRNLTHQLTIQRNAKLTLGGCLIMREKNHILIMKESKS